MHTLRISVATALLAVFGLCWLAARSASRVVVDDAVLIWFVDHRVAWLDTPMEVVSAAFQPFPAITATVVAAGLLAWWLRDWRPGVQVLASSGLTMAVVLAVKYYVSRGRPPLALQLTGETDAAFPSGHTAGAVIVAVAICVALWPALHRTGRVVALTVALTLVGLIAVSRLYLAAHWGTDVLAGAALAGAFGLFVPGWFSRLLTTNAAAVPARR